MADLLIPHARWGAIHCARVKVARHGLPGRKKNSLKKVLLDSPVGVKIEKNESILLDLFSSADSGALGRVASFQRQKGIF
jgi:hypothetical protein